MLHIKICNTMRFWKKVASAPMVRLKIGIYKAGHCVILISYWIKRNLKYGYPYLDKPAIEGIGYAIKD